MSGMKFRRTCSVCNATFFSPDRKAIYCLKCVKKRVVKHIPAEARAAEAQVTRVPRGPASQPPIAPARKERPSARQGRRPYARLRKGIVELCEEQYALTVQTQRVILK